MFSRSLSLSLSLSLSHTHTHKHIIAMHLYRTIQPHDCAVTTTMDNECVLQAPVEPAVVLPPMSARQKKAVGAWNTHKKEVDKHFVSFFEGVERDIAQVLLCVCFVHMCACICTCAT